MEPLLNLAAHVVAMILIAVPLLWATWHSKTDFRPWRTAAKVALFAFIAWLVAYGIETLIRQMAPNDYLGSVYPSERKTSYPLIARKGTREVPRTFIPAP